MLKMFIVSLAATAAVGVHSIGFLYSNKDDYFIARVLLNSDCEIDANAFAIKNLTTGEKRPFKFGEAFIKSKNSDLLKVVLNSSYPDFYFNGEEVRASKRMKIIQSCSTETTLKSIFDSFNETFSNE